MSHGYAAFAPEEAGCANGRRTDSAAKAAGSGLGRLHRGARKQFRGVMWPSCSAEVGACRGRCRGNRETVRRLAGVRERSGDGRPRPVSCPAAQPTAVGSREIAGLCWCRLHATVTG